MNLVDYEKYYHMNSEFIIPRDEFEKIIEENQRLKERIEYLERSNNRREDTIMSLRDEITEQKDYENVLNELEKEIDRLLERQYESEKFAKEQGFDTYLPAKVNLEYIKKRLNELKESDK